ncbi:MAG: ATP-binding cassette domain-containing protein [bacterium]|nr:ATP-binding cassette domain-containing protein [Candidatus Kapabacteria bacterium]
MIKIEDLHKSFGDKNVLNGVSFEIETGATTVIIGRSGTGKSVLLKLMVGLLEPDKGTVSIDGKRVDHLTNDEIFALRRNVGYVFQGAALFDSMSVADNLVLGMWEHGDRDIPKLEAEVRRNLANVGLLPDPDTVSPEEFDIAYRQLADKQPSELSGGMRKRVGVARALMGTPRYVFYDEPTTGLDPVTSEQIDNLVCDLTQKLDVTSVVITHDIFSVYKVADKVVMLDDGGIRFIGTPLEMQNSPDEVVQEFIERYAMTGAAKHVK